MDTSAWMAHDVMAAIDSRESEAGTRGSRHTVSLIRRPDSAWANSSAAQKPGVSMSGGADFLDPLTAAARGDIMGLPVLLHRLIAVPEGPAHIVRLLVRAVLKRWRPGPRTPDGPPAAP
jgi:hypothetical protein